MSNIYKFVRVESVFTKSSELTDLNNKTSESIHNIMLQKNQCIQDHLECVLSGMGLNCRDEAITKRISKCMFEEKTDYYEWRLDCKGKEDMGTLLLWHKEKITAKGIEIELAVNGN